MECLLILYETKHVFIFNRMHFIITYISLQDVTNNFTFEDIRVKYTIFLKNQQMQLSI